MSEFRDTSDFRLGYKTAIEQAMEIVSIFYEDEEAQGHKSVLPLLAEICAVFSPLATYIYLCKTCGENRVETPEEECDNCTPRS